MKHQFLIYLLLCLGIIFLVIYCLHLDFCCVIFKLLLFMPSESLNVLSVFNVFFDYFSVSIWMLFCLFVFLFLIPTPFIDLRLRQSCDFSHLANLFLSPINLSPKLLLQESDLKSAFPLSLPNTTTWLLFKMIHFIIFKADAFFDNLIIIVFTIIIPLLLVATLHC